MSARPSQAKGFLPRCTIALAVYVSGCDASFDPPWYLPDSGTAGPPAEAGPVFDASPEASVAEDAGTGEDAQTDTAEDAQTGAVDADGPLMHVSCAMVMSGSAQDAACDSDCSGACSVLCSSDAACADAWVPCASCFADAADDPPPTW